MDQQSTAQRSRTYGFVICGASVAAAFVFLTGVLRKSYWALAMPVTAGFLGALYVAFWIGRALLTTPVEPPTDD